MIISDEHRYLFVELPRTGSTAIGRELREQYGGRKILRKHSTYQDFLRIATPAQQTYFVFSGVRDPLDDVVSRYYKLKTDHNERYSHPVRSRYAVGVRRANEALAGTATLPVERRRSLPQRLENRMFRYIRRTGSDFSSFFMHYYHLPYDNWSRLAHDRFDRVIRFEHLQDDFAAVLRDLGIEQSRPLPVANRTSEKGDFRTEFSPQAARRARRVFGPYMQRWGYEMPPEWGGGSSVSWLDRVLFDALAIPRTAYWRLARGRGWIKPPA